MTDETKKLFDAPWQIWGDGCQVCDIRGTERAYCENIKDSARYARLPELYDGLMEALEIICGIPGEDACDHCSNASIDLGGPCRIREWRELLRKVKDGE